MVILGIGSGSNAFQPTVRLTASFSVMRNSLSDLSEFDFILGERNSQTLDNAQQQKTIVHSRRKVELPGDGIPGERMTVLASSTSFAGPHIEDETSEEQEADPYADLLEESPALDRYQQQDLSFGESFQSKMKQMDFQEVVSTLIVPSIFAVAGLRWGFRRVSKRVQESGDETLDAFASEMVYHDGDFEEMKLCYKDFSKKLVWMGPKKSLAMLKRYLKLYAKKKSISPRSISSLSFVFSLFKLSEEKAADLLVSICTEMGERYSSAGKLLFFGTRILKSPEGKNALSPIRDMIKASYRGEETVAETMVETSQQAMAEAAYKTAIVEGGKNQESLTVGWEVLGLDKDTATSIFKKEKEGGFTPEWERMYGNQATTYDKSGNALDKKGNLADPENAIGGNDEDEDGTPVSPVMSCKECGFTLFIAKGRESRQFGEGFKCPQCGAKKDKFEPKDVDEN